MRRLSSVAHGLSCSAACGIFPDQGSNPTLEEEGTLKIGKSRPRTRGNGSMVVLVPFVVPMVGDKTLLAWELNSGPTAEAL
ncbi:hypothetical protein J1605_004025 [Eschrichtius robustus]|uniref:Uncharacterized protein n=1 Tax=Eschrichtius robustus TaxID=9764 RepID=A0AB34HPP1_ESCRO|nr:hypothetical protein J1605_004025 [Eschrichtius robustus]